MSLCKAILALGWLAAALGRPLARADDASASTAELIQSRGFLAEDQHLTTSEGYILHLVRADNPLLADERNHKRPILFVHGLATSAKAWVIHSADAEPRNYANLNASLMSDQQLDQLLKDDPASKSLVFTALNFGHQCWLIDLRGTQPSLGHLNNNEPNEWPEGRSYWDYSLDEEALHDLPETIDYILQQTNKPKLSLIGHSAGGAKIMMLLADRPQYADKGEFELAKK